MSNENTASKVVGSTGGSALCDHPLAHKDGIKFMIGFFLHTGAMCPKCAYGTRVKSKRWAECKKCGQRIERHALPNASVSHGSAAKNPKP